MKRQTLIFFSLTLSLSLFFLIAVMEEDSSKTQFINRIKREKSGRLFPLNKNYFRLTIFNINIQQNLSHDGPNQYSSIRFAR